MSQTPIGISSIAQTDNETTYGIGDLRRAYGVPFGSVRLSKLNPSQDPLFTILAQKRNVSVNDTHFKYFEERPFLWKRYAYAVAFKLWSGSGNVPITGYTADDDLVGGGLTPQTQGSYMALKMSTDYKSSGNLQNVYGQSTNEITVGATGTLPTFFLPNQIIKVCTKSATGDLVADDFFTARIMDVQTSGQDAYLGLVVIKPIASAANKYLCSYPGGSVVSSTYDLSPGHDVAGTKTILESMRTYVIGNAYRSGTGLPGYYNTQPYSSRYGLTMIQKHAFAMDNSSMAVETRMVANEFDRMWAEKVRLHKWDIGNEIYFSDLYEESGGQRHTQGIVPWCLNYGNVFSLTSAKTQDSFLEDLSTLFDPRYNGPSQYLFVMSTYYYNWLHKLGGYGLNNMKIGYQSYGAHYTYDFSAVGPVRLCGTNLFEFSSLYGPIYAMRDVHLDGTHVKMLGVPLGQIVYRPLVGNGYNRDTTIYPGVQKIETNGVDATVNLIQTEFGIETSLPEAWAIWT